MISAPMKRAFENMGVTRSVVLYLVNNPWVMEGNVVSLGYIQSFPSAKLH